MSASTLPSPSENILVFMPEQPGDALTALQFVTALHKAMPGKRVIAVCSPAVKQLARCCMAVELVIGFQNSDKPLKRDLQLGDQLRSFYADCAIVLSKYFHPQFLIKCAKPRLSIGWKSWYSRLTLDIAISSGKWQALWQKLLPEMPYPQQLPQNIMKINKKDSASAALWLGVGKQHTIAVLTEGKLSQGWQEALDSLDKKYSLLYCQNRAGEVHSQAGFVDDKNRITKVDLYDQKVLQAFATFTLALCDSKHQEELALAFGVNPIRCDLKEPDELKSLGWSQNKSLWM